MGARILFVDNDQNDQNFVRTALIAEHHEVMAAKDALEAGEFLEFETFDLVLIDLNLPGKDGFSLVKDIRKDSRFKILPIALFTNRHESGDIKMAAQLKVNAYLIKPVKKAALIEKINALLIKKPAVRASVEVAIPSTEKRALGKISITDKGQLIEISETSITILTSLKLLVGQVVSYNCSLFIEIGISARSLIVTNISDDKASGLTKTRLNFQDLKAEEVPKLKAWLSKKHRKAA